MSIETRTQEDDCDLRLWSVDEIMAFLVKRGEDCEKADHCSTLPLELSYCATKRAVAELAELVALGRAAREGSKSVLRTTVEPIKVGSTQYSSGVQLSTVLARIERGFGYARKQYPLAASPDHEH